MSNSPGSDPVTKSEFLVARNCLTQGWYLRRATREKLGPGLKWRFWAGQDVGRRARAWLGDGVLLPSSPRAVALAATAAALALQESDLLFEATFESGGCIARADAVRRVAGGWELIEVKSAKSKEEGIADDQIDDIAFTRCVAAASGLTIAKATLVLINRDYRLSQDAEMFVSIDVSEVSAVRAAEFATGLPVIVTGVTAEERPEPEFKFACRDCDFYDSECVGQGIPDPLFAIPNLRQARFDELKVYVSIGGLPPNVRLTDNQLQVVEVIRSRKPKQDANGLAVLDKVAYPVRYLDFEAALPHLPWFDQTPPYEAVPFQYSIHSRLAEDGEVQHTAYLADHGGDWRRELAERLLSDLGASGSIVVYSSYEKTRLNALGVLFPDLAAQFRLTVARLFDLEHVFKDGYIHPAFNGKSSIKKVLPVVVPDLSYEGKPVNNGSDAMGLFSLMRVGEVTGDDALRQREDLLAYCALDTLAMVRLHDAARKIKDGAVG